MWVAVTSTNRHEWWEYLASNANPRTLQNNLLLHAKQPFSKFSAPVKSTRKSQLWSGRFGSRVVSSRASSSTSSSSSSLLRMSASDTESEYEVERIVSHRGTKPDIEYLIKWVNYGDEDNTWQTEEDVMAPSLLEAYWKEIARKKELKKPKPSSKMDSATKKRSKLDWFRGEVSDSTRAAKPSLH